MHCNPLNLSVCLPPFYRKKDLMVENDLSSKELPGQFLPADLGQIAENIIA